MKKLVEILWIDAAENSVPLDELDHTNPEDLLVQRLTYGLLYKQDKKAVVIATTIDFSEVEYIAIPRSWIKKITHYRKNKK